MKKSLAKQVLPVSFRNQLNRILERHNAFNNEEAGNRRGTGAGKKKQAGVLTQDQRRLVISQAFGILWQLGYKLREPEHLAATHVEKVVRYWEEQGLSASTLHTRIAVMNVFSRWIGKPGIVKSPQAYFPDGQMKRSCVAKQNRSWDSRSLEAEKTISAARKHDERFACMLNLQLRFGLRVMESCEIRPENALVDRGRSIEVSEGTKGGRLRRVEIESDEQIEAIEWARRLALTGAGGRLRWYGKTWAQARTRFYWLMKKMGLTRDALGVTAHGLRHEFAQNEYMAETGCLTPIQGGALGKIDCATHKAISLQVSRKLGHGRIQVTASYYGSYGHSLRGTPSYMVQYRF